MLTLLSALLATASVDECRAAYEAVSYREAAKACAEAVPKTPPEQLPEVYRLLGLSNAALDETDLALAAFVSLLTLDAAATLPDSYAPKVRAPFMQARKLGAGTPAKLTARAAR